MKNLISSFLLLVFMATLSIGCGPKPQYSTAKFDLGIPFELGAGKTANSSDDKLRITFNAIGEDSRCPEGTTCMWAGQVTANITIGDSESSQTFDFRLEGKGTKPATKKFKEYSVNLMQVTPYPQDGTKIEKEKYAVQLKVLQ